jgi:hypothetical protein
MSYAKKLSPARGGLLGKRWFILLIIIGIIASAVGLYYFGTVSLDFLFSNESIITITAIVMIAFVTKIIYDSHFIDYYLETDFNNEIKLGKKKGEFSFNLEGKNFYGVDCGSTKLILLQGTVANHEKKVLTPSMSGGRIFSLQSLKGQKLNRLILRGVPITNLNTIITLGWLGFEDIEKNLHSPTVTNLKNMITSPDWTGVIWVAPYVPDDIYKQFLFNEKSLAEIETTYEGKTDTILRDFNARIDDLKSYYLHVGSEVFHQSAEIIKTTIQSYELAAILVNYMLSKHPSEVQDTIQALNLEAKIDTLPNVIEKELRKWEQMKEQLVRFGKVFGLQPQEVEEKVSALSKLVSSAQQKIKAVTGKPAPKPIEEQAVAQ